MIQFIKVYIYAFKKFLGVLFAPKDPIVEVGESGYSSLKGWKSIPEDKILRLKDEEQAFLGHQRALLWLYCFKGPHRGEVLALKNRLETLGPSIRNSKVITPKGLAHNTIYQIEIDRSVTIETKQGANFKINHREEKEADLVDYDILEIFGNEFIVFENLAL